MGLLGMAAMLTHSQEQPTGSVALAQMPQWRSVLGSWALGQLPALQLKVCEALSHEHHTRYFVMFNKTRTNPLPSIQLDMHVPKHVPLGQTAVTRPPFELHSSISLWD